MSTTPELVAIVDYGMGNLRSVAQAVAAAARDLPVQVQVTQDPQVVRQAQRVVLPGQGAMPDCMAQLQATALLPALLQAVKTKPLFGVCVGMQMLLERSEEGPAEGLGFIPGEVKKFQLAGKLQADGSRYKVPQMGWNRVWRTAAHDQHPLWRGIEDGAWFYFVHSYFVQPADPGLVAGTCEYGVPFTCAVARDNIFAVQFHPDKSARDGLQLLKNFVEWRP